MHQQATNLVEINGMSFSCGNRQIFTDITMTVPKGKITAIMGPSGIGKTTLLRLISGQILPDKGEIWFDGKDIPSLSRYQLFEARKKMSILFQSGALFTDLTVSDNVAFPLREHTQLPEPLIRTIVLMKLEAVGLRGAGSLMPFELSGGMARRAALARAIALDPDMVLFDEPFAGQDPITMGVLVKLIEELNHSLGITCIVVSHDVSEVLSIADYAYIIADQSVITHGDSTTLLNNIDIRVRQFLDGIADGPIPFRYPANDYRDATLGISKLESNESGRIFLLNAFVLLGRLGIRLYTSFKRSGFIMFNALVGKPEFTKQWPLLCKQLYNVGVQSLLIIMVSGWLIGMVLGLQGYLILTTYSAEASLGMMVALSLLRELGPVVTSLLFAGRAGSTVTAEIGLMKATEQISSMEMMGIDPLRRVIAPRFWACIISMPLLTAVFVALGICGGSMVGINWGGVDSGLFWSAMQHAVDFYTDLINCMIKSLIFAITIIWISLLNGYDAIPTSEGISNATMRTVVHSSLAVLGLDLILTELMFGN